jgi:Xaa-Pro aminopeptidase
MTDEEIEQVNRYHARVYEELSGRLNEDEKAWLRRATSPISRHPAPLAAGRSEALDS